MSNHLQIKKLSDVELDLNLKLLFKKENEILADVLHHVREVDIRKLYLGFSYPNLFAYLTRHIGYSNGSAQRRIDAARLSQDVPELVTKIERGKVSLAQVTLIQKSIRQAQLEQGIKISAGQKISLVDDIAARNFEEAEVYVKQTLNIELVQAQHITFQKNNSVRLEVTFSADQWKKLTQMRELLSHSLPRGTWDQVLEYASDQVLRQKDKFRPVKKRSSTKSAEWDGVKPAAAELKPISTEPISTEPNFSEPSSLVTKLETRIAPKAASRKSIPASIQRAVYNRDRCCQYVDHRTEKKCQSTWQLTIDHIKPVWAAGGNELENLRVLCANHNREIYRTQSGLAKV